MTITKKTIIGLPHRAQAIGGPGSFQNRLLKQLDTCGYQIVYPDTNITPTVILVVGGTARLDWLIRCRIQGTKIVHRLDGINWRHWELNCSVGYKCKSEVRNILIRFARKYLVDEIVYQSKFVKNWWDTKYGLMPQDSVVIYNAVDLAEFYPRTESMHELPLIICAESQLIDDHVSQNTIKYLAKKLYSHGVIRGIRIIGRLGEKDKKALSALPGVELLGMVSRENMPSLYRQADIFLSLDINAACPNSVIEAMACGLPVVGFNTGALHEMVPSSAGSLASYGGNPWRLETPDCFSLSNSIEEVISNLDVLSVGARQVALERYDLNSMVSSYLKVLSN